MQCRARSCFQASSRSRSCSRSRQAIKWSSAASLRCSNHSRFVLTLCVSPETIVLQPVDHQRGSSFHASEAESSNDAGQKRYGEVDVEEERADDDGG